MLNNVSTVRKHGGGHLVHFADGMCIPSQVSFSPLFSKAGYQKKTIFLEPVGRRGSLLECVVALSAISFVGTSIRLREG